jgi:putative aldouronate transport system permease protein
MKNQTLNKSDIVFNIFNYIVLLVLTLVTVYPFYYMFIYSISDPYLAQSGITFLPAGFSLINYRGVFVLRGMMNATFISLSRTVLGTLITIICSTFFSYLVTKKEMILRKSIYRFVCISMYLNAGFIPWYLTMKMLGLTNNFLVYILPGAVTAFYVILLKTYIEQLPSELEESAKIDGAGYLITFFKIIFPLSMPIIATIAVFSAVAQWNAWIDNYFLVLNRDLNTLQLLLYQYLNQANSLATKSSQELVRGVDFTKLSPMSIRVTMTMIVTFPVLFVYPFMKKYFVKGIMIGAI